MVAKQFFLSIVAFVLIGALALTGCDSPKSEPKPAPGPKKESTEKPAPASALLPKENNPAWAGSGARAWANGNDAGFPVSALNDATEAPWGFTTGQDVIAVVTLTSPTVIKKIRVMVFAPNDRQHLREISVIASTDTASNAANWRILKSRLGSKDPYNAKVVIPKLADLSVLDLEIDPSDLEGDPKFKSYGIACLQETKGYKPNYLKQGSGNGVYVRELQFIE
jgi:hypothetical protein